LNQLNCIYEVNGLVNHILSQLLMIYMLS